MRCAPALVLSTVALAAACIFFRTVVCPLARLCCTRMQALPCCVQAVVRDLLACALVAVLIFDIFCFAFAAVLTVGAACTCALYSCVCWLTSPADTHEFDQTVLEPRAS
jgi:hypothetical protein